MAELCVEFYMSVQAKFLFFFSDSSLYMQAKCDCF